MGLFNDIDIERDFPDHGKISLQDVSHLKRS